MSLDNACVLVPAFGRDYETEEQALADWNEGKDFKVWGTSTYTSVRDVEYLLADYDYVRIIFNKRKNVLTVESVFNLEN